MGRLLDDIVSDRQSFVRQVHGAIEGHRLNGPGDTRLSSVLFGAAWPCMANVCKMAAQGTISPESATNAVSVLLEAGANPLLWDEAGGNDPFGALVDYILDANGFVPDLSDVAPLLLSVAPCALDRYLDRFAKSGGPSGMEWKQVLVKALNSKGQKKMLVYLDAALLAQNTPQISAPSRPPRL